ncbi:MAG: hypothetical protein ACHREM_32180 [Polyangiales bacterium]
MNLRCDHCGAAVPEGTSQCPFCRSPIVAVAPRPSLAGGALIASTNFRAGDLGRFKPSQYLASTKTALTDDHRRGVMTVMQASSTSVGVLNLFEAHADVALSSSVRFVCGEGPAPTFGLAVRTGVKSRYGFTMWADGTAALAYYEDHTPDRRCVVHKHAAFKPGDFNEMCIKIDDKRLRIYLNGTPIGSARDERISTGNIAIWVGGSGSPTLPVVLEMTDVFVREIE